MEGIEGEEQWKRQEDCLKKNDTKLSKLAEKY